MSRFLTVLLKECLDGLRDRRSLASAMLVPLLLPLMSTGLLVMMLSKDEADLGKDGGDPDVLVTGMEHAPGLIAWLDDHGLDPVPYDLAMLPEEAITSKTVKAVIRINEDYSERWNEARPARVELLCDDSRMDAQRYLGKIRRRIQTYSARVGGMRLLARGIAPQIVQPIEFEKVDLSTPEQRGAQVLNTIPMFLMMACFLCSMYIAIDTTAGERERGSLESLVLTSVTTNELALAKCAAASFFGLIGTILTAAALLWSCRFVDLDSLDMSLAAGPREFVMFVLICLPITALAAALQVLVATFSRSFKEAQTTLSMMILLPMAPGMVLWVHPLDEAAWHFAMPVMGQFLLFANVLQGKGLPADSFALSAVGSLVVAGLCVALCSRILRNEKIIFGR